MALAIHDPAEAPATEIPLADVAGRWLARLATTTAARAIDRLDGSTLLGERAALRGLRVPGRVSAGGGCRLYDARGGSVALNLAREDDRTLLPALFETHAVPDVAGAIARCDAATLVVRARDMGLAIAHENETAPPAVATLVEAAPAPPPGRAPRVLDLTALWAGPLATHLMLLAGADVTKVENPRRPDAMRDGDPALYARLNADKSIVRLDPAMPDGHAVLASLIAEADIVVEASRPRALLQLGIDAAAMVRTHPGIVWLSITGHGQTGAAADWVGFGDDCGVAGGLTAEMRRATGVPGFVGDAIADPLTGIRTALEGWTAWDVGRTCRLSIAMSGVAADALADAREAGAEGLDTALRAWAAAAGRRFPAGSRPC